MSKQHQVTNHCLITRMIDLAGGNGILAALVAVFMMQIGIMNGAYAAGEPTSLGPSSDAAAPAKSQAAPTRPMSPEEAAWEKILEENLGSFYLPNYKKDKAAGQETSWDYVKDDPKLPRALLIGDSISRGYTLSTRKALAGKVNLHRAPANCGRTRLGLQKLDV